MSMMRWIKRLKSSMFTINHNKIKFSRFVIILLVAASSLSSLNSCQASNHQQERQVVVTSSETTNGPHHHTGIDWASSNKLPSQKQQNQDYTLRPLANQRSEIAGLLSADSLSARTAAVNNARTTTYSNGSLVVGNEVANMLAVLADRQQSNQISARSSLNKNEQDLIRYKQPISKRETQIEPQQQRIRKRQSDDVCVERLCFGLPTGCLNTGSQSAAAAALRSPGPSLGRQLSHLNSVSTGPNGELGGSLCSVLVTSKQFIDPYRPGSRDILFELIAVPGPSVNNYAAVGFSDNGRMQGFVSECIQRRDTKTNLQIISLRHSYNIPGAYKNVPATVISGIDNLGVTNEEGYYQCRWIVKSSVEFTFEAPNGSTIVRQEDLGYKNYHILLASGEYNPVTDEKEIHTDRTSSMTPISLAQTGQIEALGAHILIRIHGSVMIAIWIGLVTLSIILARYYKNDWSNSKINDLAIWFVVHRAFMLTGWFGSIIAVIFAYMYAETYHIGPHSISGTVCLTLSTIQIIGGLLRPSTESDKRVYFNWAHFICGNLSYLCAMICLVTAAFLPQAHLSPLYMWVIVLFVGVYALAHFMMTIHQYIVHRSSKISITPMSELNSSVSTTYTTSALMDDSFPKETNSIFRQFMLGILVTVIVIFIVVLITLVNIK